MQKLKCNNTDDHSVVPFSVFLEQVGRSATCGWRWRGKGWVKTINVAGRIYIARNEIDRFHQRAAAGEFAKGSRSSVFVYDDPVAAIIKSQPTANVPRETNNPASEPTKPLGVETDNQTTE